MAFLRKLATDSTGTSAVEYALICSLMVIGMVVGVQSIGASVVTSYDSTATAIHNASAG